MKKALSLLLSGVLSLSILTSCAQEPVEITMDSFMVTAEDSKVVSMIAQIDSITEASFETEDAIISAYNTYLLLNDEEREFVANSEKLYELLDGIATLYNTSERRGDRINRNQILIGTYCFNFKDETHVKELADANIDFITATGFNQEKFDNLAKYGIGAFLSGLPSWRGDDRLPEDPQPTPTFDMTYYAQKLNEVVDHEAIWGIDIVDEPSALDYFFLAQQCDTIYEELPGYLAYINLHPGHGRARLGTVNEFEFDPGEADYREYISEYVKQVDIDFICYDHYFYQQGVPDQNELEGQLLMHKIIAEACRENDKDFWMVMQLNSRSALNNYTDNVQLTQDQLQIQVNVALAYGARAINWACWQPGWWVHNVYERDGSRSLQYERVCEVNANIKELSPIYINYKYVDTCSFGPNDHDINKMTRYYDNNIDQDTFKNITVDDDTFFLAGYFEKQGGSEGKAMFITNISDKMIASKPRADKISFEVENPDAVVTAYIMGKPHILEAENGVYSISLYNAEYAFITVE